jgi:hypothetical protein
MKEFILNYLPGILAAILASYLTARWSLKKIYAEKWWDRKEKAYKEIIEALYDSMQYCEIQKNVTEYGAKYSEEKLKDLEKQYSRAFWRLKKVTDIGAFVISNEGAKTLQDLHNRPEVRWNEEPPWEIYDQEYTYFKNALDSFVEIAKKDLKTLKV